LVFAFSGGKTVGYFFEKSLWPLPTVFAMPNQDSALDAALPAEHGASKAVRSPGSRSLGLSASSGRLAQPGRPMRRSIAVASSRS
jgi:hypothetical protein